MDYSICADLVISVDNLPEVAHSLFLPHAALGRNELRQIAALAQLRDNISIVFCGVDVVYFYYVVRVLEGL